MLVTYYAQYSLKTLIIYIEYGNVIDARIQKSKHDGDNRGMHNRGDQNAFSYGFVVFDSVESAETCSKNPPDLPNGGRLNVEKKRPKEEQQYGRVYRAGGRGGFRGGEVNFGGREFVARDGQAGGGNYMQRDGGGGGGGHYRYDGTGGGGGTYRGDYRGRGGSLHKIEL